MLRIKYILDNPNFRFVDKLQFFSFYFLGLILVVFMIWIGYKGFKEGIEVSSLDVLLFLILISPLLKYSKKFHQKFTIPYKKFIGRDIEIEKIEQTLRHNEAVHRALLETSSKLWIIEAIFVLIFAISFVFIIRIGFTNIKLYQRILPFWIFGSIIAFALFLYSSFKILVYTFPKARGLSGETIPKKWKRIINLLILILVSIFTFYIGYYFWKILENMPKLDF